MVTIFIFNGVAQTSHSYRRCQYFAEDFNKTIISFALVGYKIVVNEARTICHLISNARSLNNY